MLIKTAYKFITKEKKYISLNRENTFVFYNLKWILKKILLRWVNVKVQIQMVVVRMNFFGINKSVDIFTFLGKKILSVSHGKHYPALLEYDTCYLVKLYTINKWGEQNPRWIIATILQNWHFYCVLNVQGFSPWQWY